MEVFSLQWLLLNYSAKFLPTIKLNYAYCNQRQLLYQLGHITPYCSIQWARSFRHIAVNSTCQHHCSTAYQVFSSNPYPLDCCVCTHSTLKWQHYIQFHLLAIAQIPYFLSILSCLFQKSAMKHNIFGCWNVYIWGELKLSGCDYTA